MSGEKDILIGLAFTSSSLFIMGTFTGPTYLLTANPSHFIYKTLPDFVDGSSCTALPIEDSEVTISEGDLQFFSSAAIIGLVSSIPTFTTTPSTTAAYSQTPTELCFQDVVPFEIADKSVVIGEMLTFTIGPFCSQRDLPITVSVAPVGASSLPAGFTYNETTQ